MIDWRSSKILITGGTGSFGKSFVQNILSRYPDVSRLVIFSRDELKQFEMSQEFSDDKYPGIRYLLGDVRDQNRLRRAFLKILEAKPKLPRQKTLLALQHLTRDHEAGLRERTEHVVKNLRNRRHTLHAVERVFKVRLGGVISAQLAHTLGRERLKVGDDAGHRRRQIERRGGGPHRRARLTE